MGDFFKFSTFGVGFLFTPFAAIPPNPTVTLLIPGSGVLQTLPGTGLSGSLFLEL